MQRKAEAFRVVTGAISHESSTFTTVPTTWESYTKQRFGYLRGEEILQKFRGTNTPIGGYIVGAEAHGFDLVPTIFANAHPSAPTPRPIFDAILTELLDAIASAGPVDGVLLELHGAMVAEGIDDGEGYILAAVRDLVGPQVPILAELDIHSNVSQHMVAMADVLIGRETYPEIDQAERARECTDILARMLSKGVRPTMALHQIPMVWGMNQVTAHPPMNEAIAELHRIEAQPGVICGSIATCYPLADIPDMGASVYIVTDNDLTLAQSYADELGQWLFDRRADWHTPFLSTTEALAQADSEGKYPAIFADRNDNTGGGSPGDSTGMLRTFIEAGLSDACILYIVDPEAVAQCQAVGVGETLTLDIGGKSSPLQGAPLTMTAEVKALSDGQFRYHGPRNAGLGGSMGPSAHIKQNGIHVLLVSEREQPYDTAFSESMGLDPRRMTYIGIKSTVHFRAGFESWAGAIYAVSEPSVQDSSTGNLPFHNLGRKLYPLHNF